MRYGAEKGYAFDTFLPERPCYTFNFFGTVILIGLGLLLLRWLEALGLKEGTS
ncbi:MAG: hypothetical protein R2911_05890 [Caldilineaceae bacterium]